MSIIPFKSKRDFTCEQNLKAFVKRAKEELTIYEVDGGFGSTTWYRIMKAGKKVTMAFTEFESSAGKGDGDVFQQPFLDFARAYVREQQSINEVAPAPMMAGLKAIYYGLMEVHNKPDILLLDNPSITKAKEAIKGRIGAQARYAIGGHMKKLIKWVKDNRICLNHTVWQKNPWPRQKDKAEGTSDEDRKWQDDRLLNSHEVGALADAFVKAKTPYEIYWSSCSVLLMYAPNRAGELHFLSTDCLFETTAIKQEMNKNTGEVEEKEITVLNLRWKAAKGGGTIPKPVHPKLEHTVKEAVARLITFGKPAREAAAWATNNPRKFFRHEGCITNPDFSEDAPLNYAQLCAALNLTDTAKTDSARLKTDPLELVEMAPLRTDWFRKLAEGKANISYRDLAKYTVGKYSKIYPKWPKLEEVDGLVSESLCLIRENELHKEFSPKGYSWLTPSVNLFNDAFGSSDTRSEISESIFDSLGITNEDGTPISISTHQVRTWLSTMAEKGEMDSLDLALFAGRTRIEDNRAYDLRSPEEREATARAVLNIPKDNGLRAIEQVKHNVPVTFESLGRKDRVGTAQPTGYGFCEHDWAMSPCVKAGNCITCKEHACVKGLPKSLERLQKLEVTQCNEFERARDAHEAGEYGAESWMVFQGKRLAVIRTVISIYEDGNVPDGVVIRIPKELDPTETQVTLIEKGLKTEIVADDAVSQNIIEATQNEFLALLGG